MDVEGLARELEYRQQYNKNLYWGNCLPPNHQRVIRDETSKWFVSRNVYKESLYPPYCIGGGYAFSKNVVECMNQFLNDTAHFPLEDVASGMLASKCQIRPFKYFNTAVKDLTSIEDLSYLRLIYHKVKGKDMWKLYDLYRKGDVEWQRGQDPTELPPMLVSTYLA